MSVLIYSLYLSDDQCMFVMSLHSVGLIILRYIASSKNTDIHFITNFCYPYKNFQSKCFLNGYMTIQILMRYLQGPHLKI